jgi:hypothetical protein
LLLFFVGQRLDVLLFLLMSFVHGRYGRTPPSITATVPWTVVSPFSRLLVISWSAHLFEMK